MNYRDILEKIKNITAVVAQILVITFIGGYGALVIGKVIIKEIKDEPDFVIEYKIGYDCKKAKRSTLLHYGLECIEKVKTIDCANNKCVDIVQQIIFGCEKFAHEEYCKKKYVPYINQPISKIRFGDGFVREIPCSEAILKEQKNICNKFIKEKNK